MMRTTLAAGLFGLGLCLAGPAGAVTEDQFRLHNTGDLAALCSAPTTDPLYTAAINFCYGFGAGAYSVFGAAQQAYPKGGLFCPPKDITRNDAVAAFVAWAGGSPDRAALPAVDGIAEFLNQTYPCAKATHRRTR